MGNCVDTFAQNDQNQQVEEKKRESEEEEVHQRESIIRPGNNSVRNEDGFGKSTSSGFRVKIVLTKEELEWLLFQLHEKGGNKKRLEDVLGEMERSVRRRSVVDDDDGKGWKPSLDSIMESPEVPEMDRSS